MNQQSPQQHRRGANAILGAAIACALALPQLASAGSFQLPTVNAAGWARAQAGGSLWTNDPTAAYNNPAAMAFFTAPVLQVTATGVRPSAKYHGDFRDEQGNPVSGGNPDGFGKFKPFPNIAYVQPVNDRLAFGLNLSVPYGLASDYNKGWQGRYFGTGTDLQSIALSLSLGFKVNDEFSIGAGILGQRTKAQLNTTLDPYGSAAAVFGAPLLGAPQKGDVALNIDVKRKASFGYFAGFEWKPTSRDNIGVSYHSRVKNTLAGTYRLYGSPSNVNLLVLAGSLGLPGVPSLNADGARASAQLDTPAFASIDWTHAFTDRLTLGASAKWTDWSHFESLTLVSEGQTLVSLPEKYKDAWIYSVGGDYKLNDAWTLRAGVGYDKTPTKIVSRDPRIPDGTRRLLGLGVGYQATEHLGFDLGYQHQFVTDTPVRLTNPVALGAGSMNGKFKDKGDVVSFNGTYTF